MIRSFVILAVVAIPITAVASADDPAVLDEMVAINRKALDHLKAGRKEQARDALLSAVLVGRGAGLADHQMMARTYLHLGAVYLIGFGDREQAMQQLTAAVRIRPTIQLTPQLVTPELEEAFRAAHVERSADPPAKSPPPPPAQATLVEDAHTTVEVVHSPPRGSVWVGLGLGSGVGWHTRRDLESQRDFELPAGVGATAAIHFAPEIGYRLYERVAVSLQSRHQLIPKIGWVLNQRPRFAHAVFARGHGLLAALGEATELWGTFAVGGGSAFRVFVPAKPAAGLGGSDTISAGPLAFGPGVSLVYRAAGQFSLLGEARALAAVPRFAALVDVTLGGSYSF